MVQSLENSVFVFFLCIILITKQKKKMEQNPQNKAVT